MLGWSVTGSAPLESQLSAVLAGFVFTSIVFLFGREGQTQSHTLGLFCAAFVTLGFDSHLFSVVSGSASDTICLRVWSLAMPASGMLGVGAMAIITGITWLLPSHLSNTSITTDKARQNGNLHSVNLNGIVLAMAYGVSVTVILLLGSTTYSYFYVVKYPHAVPNAWADWTWVAPLIVGALAIAFALMRRFWRQHHPHSVDRFSERALQLAAYGIMAYAIIGTVFSGLVTELANSWWRSSHASIVFGSVAIGLIMPGLLMIALVHAKPALHERYMVSRAAPEDNSERGKHFGPRHAKQSNNTREHN